MSDICVEAFIIEESAGEKIKSVLSTVGKAISEAFRKIVEMIKRIVEKIKSLKSKNDKTNNSVDDNTTSTGIKVRFWEDDQIKLKVSSNLPNEFNDIKSIKDYINGMFDDALYIMESVCRVKDTYKYNDTIVDIINWAKTYFRYDIKGEIDDREEDNQKLKLAKVTAASHYVSSSQAVSMEMIKTVFGSYSEQITTMTPKELKESNINGYKNIDTINENDLVTFAGKLLKFTNRIESATKKIAVTCNPSKDKELISNNFGGIIVFISIINHTLEDVSNILAWYFSSILSILNSMCRYNDDNDDEDDDKYIIGRDSYFINKNSRYGKRSEVT